MFKNQYWYAIKDGDPRAVALYRRHYSATLTNHGMPIDHCRYGFSGQGESLILLTLDCRALFGWNKSNGRADKQEGVNCFVFRNEGGVLSSDLIREADLLAWQRWGDERHFTYVKPSAIKSTNPGYCFIKAGYRKCGESKGGLVILETVIQGRDAQERERK